MNRQQLLFMDKGGQITDGFQDLIRELYKVADIYRQVTCRMIEEIRPFLEPRCQLSLEFISNLYLMVFERIDIQNGSFATEELNPTTEEIKERVWLVIESPTICWHTAPEVRNI